MVTQNVLENDHGNKRRIVSIWSFCLACVVSDFKNVLGGSLNLNGHQRLAMFVFLSLTQQESHWWLAVNGGRDEVSPLTPDSVAFCRLCTHGGGIQALDIF